MELVKPVGRATKLDIHVCSLEEANKFVPEKRTGIMRIRGSHKYMNAGYDSLRPSKLWVAEFNYMFDDITWLTASNMLRHAEKTPDQSEEYIYLSKGLAGEIAYNFNSVMPEIEALVVHCKNGESRSPAIALALNGAFDLGYNQKEIRLQFPNYNQPIYRIVFVAGRKLREENK